MNSDNRHPMRPEQNFKVGAVRAAIWPTTIYNSDGTSFEKKKVVLDRRYKTKQGEWKSTSSLDVNDVPKAILALQQAYEYLMTSPGKETNGVEEIAIQGEADEAPQGVQPQLR